MSERGVWAEKRAEILASPEAREAYEAARVAFELGAAVRNRRRELGLSQARLAERAGMQQPAVARLEAGGTVPSIPVLERIAAALDMKVNIGFQPLEETG
ncbi:helix-turn-helix domain-containing protein [Marinactinospora rubrisoli]|uniref:Helix-turn-helix domain-containing protein n=1 Tax=Marinactinospora rubrisoli TaxID=2715399 RepID=A0ABW2KLU9_9ACTN